MPLVLALESSCDETAAALIDGDRAVRSSIVASQHDLHERYAGVVPEVASRSHLEHITPVLRAACRAAKVTLGDVDAVAVDVAQCSAHQKLFVSDFHTCLRVRLFME